MSHLSPISSFQDALPFTTGGLEPLSLAVLGLDEGLADLRALVARHGASDSCAPRWVTLWAQLVNPDIVIVVAKRGAVPVMALPLEIISKAGMRCARHVGGSHANANFPALDGALVGADINMLDAVCAALRACGRGIDMLRLERQLASRNGVANPLVGDGSVTSPNVALEMRVDCGFESVLERTNAKRKRKRHRAALRKFEAAGGVSVVDPVPADAVGAVLDAYFAMKASQFSRKGMHNAFGDPAQQAFFKALMVPLAGGAEAHQFQLSALMVGDIVRAVMGQSLSGGRQSIHFMAFADDELASTSPGDFLNHSLIEKACAGPQAVYDLGVGDEGYKRSWCDIEVHHFDTLLGLTAKGRAAALGMKLVQTAKRRIKTHPVLWPMIKKLRKAIGGSSGTPAVAAPADAD